MFILFRHHVNQEEDWWEGVVDDVGDDGRRGREGQGTGGGQYNYDTNTEDRLR